MGKACSRRSPPEHLAERAFQEQEQCAEKLGMPALVRFRAAVRIIIYHLDKRKKWAAYGRRLQKDPGLKAIFDRVKRRNGRLFWRVEQ
jgi:hypothetical protein